MRSNLLSVAILAGIGVMATTGAAHAQSVSASDVAQLKAQIAALQSKVDALEAQSDAQSDVNVQQAQALEAASKTGDTSGLSKLVNNTQVSGRIYYDVSNIDHTVGDVKQANSGTGFDIKRAYLGIDHKFNDIYSMNLTTDFAYDTSTGHSDLYIKKAYLDAKFDPMFDLKAGANDMPWVPYVEGIYGYRYVDKTVTDQLSLATSSDWGLHASGANSVVNYAVSVVNGFGYKAAPDNGTNNRSKSVDFEGRVAFTPITGLNIAAGFYSGKKGKDVENFAYGTTHLDTASRFDGLVAYKTSTFGLGAEYFQSKNYANPVLAAGATDVKEDGFSIFGNINLTASGIALFARYDDVNTDKDDANHNGYDPKYKFYNIGVEFPLAKGVKIAPVYRDYKTDGAAGTAATENETKEFGVFGEFRF